MVVNEDDSAPPLKIFHNQIKPHPSPRPTPRPKPTPEPRQCAEFIQDCNETPCCETLTCTWLPLPLGGMGYRCIPDWDPVFKTYVAAEQAGILDAPSKPTPKPSPKQCASLAEDCKKTECCDVLSCTALPFPFTMGG